jgi:hypothetical protein
MGALEAINSLVIQSNLYLAQPRPFVAVLEKYVEQIRANALLGCLTLRLKILQHRA